MDLYARLEELQGMTRLLIDDVDRLQGELGAGNPDPSEPQQTNRRCYIRAVFALVEAFVEQHRRLLVELAAHQMITLLPQKLQRLREIRAVTLPDGTVGEQEQYLQLFDKIKMVYKAASVGFGQSLKVTFGDKGWVTFKDAMEIRHRVTHPKRVEDCWIFETNIQTAMAAHGWFKKLQNEFVRVAAPRLRSFSSVSSMSSTVNMTRR
jgi:hypothetical protein